MFVPEKKPILSPRLEALALSNLSSLTENEEILFSEEKFMKKMKELTNTILNYEDNNKASTSDQTNNDIDDDSFNGSDRIRHIQAMRNKRQHFVDSLHHPPREQMTKTDQMTVSKLSPKVEEVDRINQRTFESMSHVCVYLITKL